MVDIKRRIIMAPCQEDGVVNSVWPARDGSVEEALYELPDDDSKGAECRCKLGSCCVDDKNRVIDGTAFNILP